MKGRLFCLVVGMLLLAGCVAGQHIKMDYIPDGMTTGKSYNSVQLSVNDSRKYVVSGEKDKSYIGRYRAGFGNPWSVTTYQKLPLEKQFIRDLNEELASLGFNENSPTPNRKTLVVDIKDWDFDGFQNGRFWYEIAVTVEDASGNTVVTDTLKDEAVVKGTVMSGAKGGFEKEIPVFYDKVIKDMVRNNQKVFDALTK